MADAVIIDGRTHVATSIAVAAVEPSACEQLIAVLRARWNQLPGLKAAGLHRSFGNDAIVELLQWDAAGDGVALARRTYEDPGYRELRWRDFGAGQAAVLTPGPDVAAKGFRLAIDAAAPQPVVLTVMSCTSDRHDALLEYLVQSAARFRGLFGGWIGAAMFPHHDRSGVTEYLQFESPEAMLKLQDLQVIHDHRARLESFGPVTAAAIIPVDCWRAERRAGA